MGICGGLRSCTLRNTGFEDLPVGILKTDGAVDVDRQDRRPDCRCAVSLAKHDAMPCHAMPYPIGIPCLVARSAKASEPICRRLPGLYCKLADDQDPGSMWRGLCSTVRRGEACRLGAGDRWPSSRLVRLKAAKGGKGSCCCVDGCDRNSMNQSIPDVAPLWAIGNPAPVAGAMDLRWRRSRP
jgi:hypothetical protein